MSVLSTSGRPYNLPDFARTNQRLYNDNECFSDDDSSSISPISDKIARRSGTHWTRFFPELSSHFTLVSPLGSPPRQVTDMPSNVKSLVRPMHRNSLDSEETKSGPSSLLSDETPDDASSCYSRRSSVTSLGSEFSRYAYKSADAFSIISPNRAGVFDDSASAFRSPTSISRGNSATEAKHKPLPPPPPIQLAPLSVRCKHKPELSTYEDGFEVSTNAASSDRIRPHNPTLSQAAEELENALAYLGEQNKQQNSTQTSLACLGTPLQVSRGNMDMIPTRPAPQPPVSLQSKGHMAKALSADDIKHAMKARGKAGFSFPGFVKKHNRFHLRSSSSSSSEGGVKSPPSQVYRAAKVPENRALVNSERELRQKLPRLQTVEMKREPLQRSDHLILKPKRAYSNPEEKSFAASSKVEMAELDCGNYDMDKFSGPDMVYELGADSSPRLPELPAPVFVPSGEMPKNLPDAIVRSILAQCNSLSDLFNFAVMNKQFYRVFKSDELELMKCSMFAMSPAAWELREISPPWWQGSIDPDAPVPEYTPNIYLERYCDDMYTLVKLKERILAQCATFLRPETILGLAGQDDVRATEIDNAFWRVWTFCRIFGSGKGREGDIAGQLDWLNGGIMARSQDISFAMTEPFGMNNVLFEPPEGFGYGNTGGLSQNQLYDMMELWTCLGVLLQPIHGKCVEARNAGIYEGHNVLEGDTAKEADLLEEWTYYILSFGPSIVMEMASITATDNVTEVFQRAESMGLTKWELADSKRSSFFREAVSKAYKPRNDTPVRKKIRHSKTRSIASSSQSSRPHAEERRSSYPSDGHPILDRNRRRQAVYADQLRNQPKKEALPIEERPLSRYEKIMDHLEAPSHLQSLALPESSKTQPPPRRPPPTTQKSPTITQPGPQAISTGTPARAITPVATASPPTSQYQQYYPQVRDPVDQAIYTMVHELGFREEDVKWALKVTDTGEGIDPDAAASLLFREYQNYEQRNDCPTLQSNKDDVLLSVIYSEESLNSVWRWA